MRPTPRFALRLALRPVLLLACVTPLLATPLLAQGRDMGGGKCTDNRFNCADTPNPLPATRTVWLEEMTWMDVRDALAAGKTTIIIPTGGVEPNGPWLALGKHNYVLQANCEAIARKLGNALCAPIVKFVPEGGVDPVSGHMASPGTITMREGTFRALLTDIVTSLKVHGFTNIILIGDSGGNQGGQRAVADSLTAIWKGAPVVAHVQEYYDYAGVKKYMESKGVKEDKPEGMHDDPVISLNMFITNPQSIRYDQRVRLGKAGINGTSLANRAQATRWAKEIVEYRATTTVEAIRKAIANKGTLPAPAK